VRYEVVRALGAMPDKSSVDPLLRLFQRKDEEHFIKAAVLRAFASISDQRVVRALRAELNAKPRDGEPDYRAEAFDALWHNRHLMAKTTLVADTRKALSSDNDSLVLEATLAAAELRSPQLVTVLTSLLEHGNAEVRNKSAYALGRIGDKSATAALLAQLPHVRESRMLNNIAFALERLDKKAFYESIKQIIEHKQAIIRLNAAFVLGDVRHAEGLPMLEKALGDASDYVRTSALVAVGKLGNTSAAEREQAIAGLTPYVDHANLSVKQEAVYAIHSLTENGRADLIHDKLYSLDRNKHGDVVQRAAIELAKSGDRRVLGDVLGCYVQWGCGGDGVARFLLANKSDAVDGRMLVSWARGHEHLTSMLGRLKPAGAVPLARGALEDDWPHPWSPNTRASLELLGSLGDASVVPVLTKRSGSEHTWARVRALVAATRLGDLSSAGRLAAELDNIPAEWLPTFVRALSLIDQPSARAALQSELDKRQNDPDVVIALAAAAIRLSWDPEGAIFRFLDALASDASHERDLAEMYLRKNNARTLTFVLRRALAREGRESTRDRLRALLDKRP
jgi:HEAT repeat protein